MNQVIRNWTSLNNLKKANITGQMATFLILIITVMLIFVLSLVNVGQVSNYATTLANAADSASLSLASQLGTKAYQLSSSLYKSCRNGKKCCQGGGFWGIIKAIIISVVAWYFGPLAAIALSTLLGAVDGTGAAQGAIQGAIIAATVVASELAVAQIGSMLASLQSGATAGATAGATGGAATGAAEGAAAGAAEGAATGNLVVSLTMQSGGGTSGAMSASWAALSTAQRAAQMGTFGAVGGSASLGAGASGLGTSAAQSLAGGMGSGIGSAGSAAAKWAALSTAQRAAQMGTFGAVGGASASLGASIAAGGLATALAATNAYIKMEMQADAMAAAAKALNGLPEKKRYRESTFLHAFSDTIDDPNKVADETDIDDDGDTAEKMPVFQVLWDRRVQELKGSNDPTIKQAQEIIDNYFSSTVSNFQDAMDNFKATLDRMEVEGSDGIVTELLRGLEIGDGISPQYPVSFWDPGPDKAALNPPEEEAEDCDECEPPPVSPPPGYDELDFTISSLQTISDQLKALKGDADANTWSQWGHLLYDTEPEDSDEDGPDAEDGEDVTEDNVPGETNWSIYDSVGSIVNGDNSFNPPQIGIRAWNNEIESIRLRLSACTYDLANPEGSPTNPPCLGHPTIPDFATIDTDLDNEFPPVQEAINQFAALAEVFRQATKEFYEVVSQLLPEDEPESPPVAAGYGLSGTNPVTYRWQDSRGDHSITVEIYKFKMPKIKTKKSFFKVCLKLKRYKQKVKLRITRTDPSNVAVGVGGLLGRWNPSGGTISRTSVAKYRAVKYKTEEKEARKNYVKIVRTTWNKK